MSNSRTTEARLRLTKRLPVPSSGRGRRIAAQVVILLVLFIIFGLPELIEVLDTPDTIIASMLRHSVVALPILLLVAEEAGVPLPLPGDVVIAYIGFRASRGAIPYPVAFVALQAAVLGGASLLYYMSSRWGEKLVAKVGRFMHLNPDHLRSAERQFQTHGAWFIIVGRHIPGFRIPITVFCGISHVRYRLFLVSTFISTTFWIVFWLIVGSRLGPKTVHLLHGHHWYTIFIPIAVMVAGALIVRSVMQVRTARAAREAS